MTDLIVIGILLIIIGAAIVYIAKEKKNGAKCIGCPSGCKCSGKKDGHSDCSCHYDAKEK